MEQDCADLSNIAAAPGQGDKGRKQVYPNHQRGGLSIWTARFPFAIIQDGPQCDKSPNDFRAPEDKPAMHLENYGGWEVGGLGYQPFKAGKPSSDVAVGHFLIPPQSLSLRGASVYMHWFN